MNAGPPTPFVVLCSPRSGSNYLLNLLAQHRRSKCFYELFHPQSEKRSRFFEHLYDDKQDGGSFAASVFAWPYPRRIRAVGFKLFYANAQEGPPAGVWRYLQINRRVRIIHLRRENRFASYVSLQKALRTDHWLKKRFSLHESSPELPAFTVSADEFRAYLQTQDTLCAKALSYVSKNPTLEITYEDLCNSRHSTMASLFRFLGLPRFPDTLLLRQKIVKQQTAPLHTQVSNYQELKEVFAGTQEAAFFSEQVA